MRCPNCQSDVFIRSEQRDILEKKIYPLFGYFPWRCKQCGARVFKRTRGDRKVPR
jgi:DNA-directed RNA polymerase subunit RPC12/RpoP